MIIDLLVFQKVVPNPSAICDAIGLERQNLSKLRKGKRHFTPPMISEFCKQFNVNANCVHGIEDNVFNFAGSPGITDLKPLYVAGNATNLGRGQI